jgi:hypothetical protein
MWPSIIIVCLSSLLGIHSLRPMAAGGVGQPVGGASFDGDAPMLCTRGTESYSQLRILVCTYPNGGQLAWLDQGNVPPLLEVYDPRDGYLRTPAGATTLSPDTRHRRLARVTIWRVDSEARPWMLHYQDQTWFPWGFDSMDCADVFFREYNDSVARRRFEVPIWLATHSYSMSDVLNVRLVLNDGTTCSILMDRW